MKDDILERCGFSIDVSIIRRILKDKLNYSYKRCSVRPFNLDHKNTQMKKILFTVKLLKTLKRDTVMVNIDE